MTLLMEREDQHVIDAIAAIVDEEERELEREELPATGPRIPSAGPAVRGCGPHCHHTSNTSIWHCPCKQCHGS